MQGALASAGAFDADPWRKIGASRRVAWESCQPLLLCLDYLWLDSDLLISHPLYLLRGCKPCVWHGGTVCAGGPRLEEIGCTSPWLSPRPGAGALGWAAGPAPGIGVGWLAMILWAGQALQPICILQPSCLTAQTPVDPEDNEMIVEVGGGPKLNISGQRAANPAQRACLQSPSDFKMTGAVRDEPEVIVIAGGSVV
ncbi:hypothetical protein NDU88_002241 [Pleurodeles waltl]|uniref:Uncharacterized protein n=1 Tax=Pleurodeles waltl TaxID=8319 RepID=A0AAV7T2M1_PLEWA|nr:hypothetical protein NDU88_002241 [Pleurodeles waltl]